MLFIVFEGLNGAGKSSLAKDLAKALRAKYITSPHKNIANLREIMDDASLSAHYFYYMLGNIMISDELIKNNSKEIVICDRYVDSTIARHKVLGLEISTADISQLDLKKPDIKFFIHCNEVVRRERIEKRGKKNKWDALDENKEMRSEYSKYFQKDKEYIFIDTSGETQTESLNKILEILQERVE